jgi:hypothetical protein
MPVPTVTSSPTGVSQLGLRHLEVGHPFLRLVIAAVLYRDLRSRSWGQSFRRGVVLVVADVLAPVGGDMFIVDFVEREVDH